VVIVFVDEYGLVGSPRQFFYQLQSAKTTPYHYYSGQANVGKPWQWCMCGRFHYAANLMRWLAFKKRLFTGPRHYFYTTLVFDRINSCYF
jgi:hypothetical protein